MKPPSAPSPPCILAGLLLASGVLLSGCVAFGPDKWNNDYYWNDGYYGGYGYYNGYGYHDPWGSGYRHYRATDRDRSSRRSQPVYNDAQHRVPDHKPDRKPPPGLEHKGRPGPPREHARPPSAHDGRGKRPFTQRGTHTSPPRKETPRYQDRQASGQERPRRSYERSHNRKAAAPKAPERHQERNSSRR